MMFFGSCSNDDEDDDGDGDADKDYNKGSHFKPLYELTQCLQEIHEEGFILFPFCKVLTCSLIEIPRVHLFSSICS